MRARELRAARARLKLSQAKLADVLGLHWVTICNYERGQDPIPRLVALAIEALL